MGIVVGLGGVGSAMGYSGDGERKWEPLETQLAKFLQPKLQSEISKEDLNWLVAKIGKSSTLDSTWQAMLLKLKLEFGEELGRHNAALERQRAIQAAQYKKRQEDRAKEEAEHQKMLMELRKREKVLQDQFIKLEQYMDRNYVRSRLHVPGDLWKMYDECIEQGILEQYWFRRYRIVGTYKNPFTRQIQQLRSHRSHHYYDSF